MFADKEVKAIFSIRGGYGTPRILDLINYNLIRKHPKILVGYSDLTALQLAIFRKTGLISFSGPMVAVEMYDKMDVFTEENFWRMLTSTKKIGKLVNPDGLPLIVLKKGSAKGLLLGGNLSLINSLVGTTYLPNLAKCILIIEDVDEEPHRVDRYLAQLKLARVLQKINGLVLGCFTDCVPKDKEKPNLTVDQVVDDYMKSLGVPAISNMTYGHVPRKLTIPFGVEAKLNATRGYLEILEGAVK
jgi:muramoyltetrapeptide carboxypeptidase